VPIPTLGPISFGADSAMYYIVIPIAIAASLFARNITRTRTGRAFISVRDNDLAAELLGINVFAYKLQAFFLSAVYAGIAGCLMAFHTNNISLDFFGPGVSIEMLAMLIIGGAGYPLGPLFGVAFVSLLTQNIIPSIIPPLYASLPALLPFLNPVNVFAALNPLLFGLSLMVFLIIEPRGLAYRWEILKISWKIRPYSY
jgi:branched-chain amino acid transport system permease protein